ncbi:MAG TPA: hypothetical protein VFN55_10450 [Solirubrobacteraceae bacterium]|nr:hypothetical protein [Solirubrobacteraceae bacterium]
MESLSSLRVVLDLDPTSVPIRGRVTAEGDGDTHPFSGWIELSSLIERIRAEMVRPKL